MGHSSGAQITHVYTKVNNAVLVKMPSQHRATLGEGL